MIYMLGLLEEQGRLKNFTALAEAVIRVDESLKYVDDQKALTRVSRMLDHIFRQAYRGERPMSFLAERVESVLEVLELVKQPEPGPTTEPDPADDPWPAAIPTPVGASACRDQDDAPTSVWSYRTDDSGSTYDGWGDGSPL